MTKNGPGTGYCGYCRQGWELPAEHDCRAPIALVNRMREQGLTAYALAKAADISISMAYAVASGQRKPGLETARRIAAALHSSVNKLF